MLVDDSREVRALVRRTLESSGMFEVVGEGGDGDEAFGLVHRHEPALLLLDTSMPRVDGIDALPPIVALHPETKVVMFTGFEEPALSARVLEFGAADFLEKSIPLEELPERLMRTLSDPPPGPSSGRTDRRLSVAGGASRPDVDPIAAEQLVLNEHVQQFRALFDQAAIGMATLTVTGTIVRANWALARLMSCSPYDLVGVEYGRLAEGAGDELDRGLEAISTGTDLATFEHNCPRNRDEDTTRIVRVTLAPIRDSNGEVLYVFAQVQDISAQRAAEGDLRRSEEVFRLLVTAVGEYAIFMLDVDGNVISWNSGAEHIKGYAADQIVGRNFRVFYPPHERETWHPERNLAAALRDGRFAEEGWRIRKDGSRFWASVVISPVYDDAGNHVGFAKVTRDQTGQREHEEQRRTSVAEQSHLLAVTAHELRAPTAVIDGSASALSGSWDQMSAADRDALLTGIRNSAHRLRRLVSDLTTASRLHGETLEFRREDLSLTDTLRNAAARTLAAEPGVHIAVDVADEAVLHADASRLDQALDNLLDNAIRHGSLPITLSGIVAQDDVRIRVTDAGPGIPAELVPRVFERFAVGGPSGGTGLGLFLVREIALGHGGDAEYQPPGRGQRTTFEIKLPRPR